MRSKARLMPGLLTAIVLLAVTTAASSNPLKGLERLFDKWGLFQGVQVSGQNTLTLQEHRVEGSAGAFEGQRWDTGALQRRTSLGIEGAIWKELGFRADLSFSGYGARYSRWLVGYVGHDTALYYGDLNISLRDNEFASFGKSLKGWQLDQKLPNDGLLRAFTSEAKGYTRNESLAGNDTPGPYFLRFAPIIDSSEIIKVDEQRQRRGVDYRLNYQSGELWFAPVDGPSRAIPSTSTISVSYQSSGYFGNAGTLTGTRIQMPLEGGRMMVGLTWLEQDRAEAGQGDTIAYQEDIYYGSGTTGPFDTNFRPVIADGAEMVFQGRTQVIAEALKVFVDDVQMREALDYDAYRQIGRVIFRLAVPPTSLVRIQYYYELGQTALSDDAEVTGLDLTYQISKDLSLKADFASSASQGASGSALQTVVNYRQPRFGVQAAYRDVAPQFSYIDSTGFRHNDKGLKLALDWQPSEHINVHSYREDMDSTQGLSFGYSGYGGGAGFDTGLTQAGSIGPTETTPAQTVGVKRDDIGVELRFPGWPVAMLRRQTMSNAGGTQGGSDYTATSLNLQHALSEALRLQVSLSETDQNYLGTASAGATGSQTQQRRLSVTYSPSSSLNLVADVGNNRSLALGSSDNRSTSGYVRLQGRWSPSDRLSFNLSRRASTSHGRVTSGFYGGFPGSGYGGGGGFPGPIAGAVPGLWPSGLITAAQDDDDEVPHNEDTTTSVSASYQPTDKLTLTLTAGQRDYISGGGRGYLADSSQDYHNLGLSWQATDEVTLTTSFSRDDLQFLQEGRGAVNNNSTVVGLNYQPQDKPWGVNLSMNRMSGTSPSYIQIGSRERYFQTGTDLFDLSGQLHYRLSDKANLVARAGLSNFDSGYAAFRKHRAEIGLDYALGRSNRLTFGYRFMRHRAGEPSSPFLGYTGTTVASQDYNANTFMLGLQSNFTSGLGGSKFKGPAASMESGPPRGTFGGYQTDGGFGQAGLGQEGVGQQRQGYGLPGSLGGSRYPGQGYSNMGPQW